MENIKNIELVKCKTALNIYPEEKFLFATINPYLGCQNQCEYCYVNFDKYLKVEFLNLIKVKYNIIDILVKELSRLIKKFPQGIIYLGTSCDPYQIVECQYNLSNRILNLLLYHTPYNIHIFTKSKYILKDLDIFKKFKKRINISFTIISCLEKIRKIFEKFASSIKERLNCIKKLSLEDINCGCSIMPILPYITDNEEILNELCYNLEKNFCKYIWWDYLTLRENLFDSKKISQKQRYFSILKIYYPELIEEYNLLYKNNIAPDISYRKLINFRIINIAKKYRLNYCGPKWLNSHSSLPQFYFEF